MPVWQPLRKRITGDKAVASRYQKLAEKWLGELKWFIERAGIEQHTWYKTLENGTRIMVRSQFGLDEVRIDVTETVLEEEENEEFYLETGLLSHRARSESNCDTYRPADRYYPAVVADYADTWTGKNLFYKDRDTDAPLGRARLVQKTTISGESKPEGKSLAVGCTDPVPVMRPPGRDTDCSGYLYCDDPEMWARKFAQTKHPASLYSGAMRHFIQALYGAKTRKYYAFHDADPPIPMEIPPLQIFSDELLYDAVITGFPTHGIIKTQGGYYLLALGFDGTYYSRKLLFAKKGARLYKAAVAKWGTALYLPEAERDLEDEQKHEKATYEGYLFAHVVGLGPAVYGFFDWPEDERTYGEPIYYGWKFTRMGEKASVVLKYRKPSESGDNYNFYMTRLTLNIDLPPGTETFQITVDEIDGPHHIRSRVSHQMVWVPNLFPTGMDHYTFYSCEGNHDDASLQWDKVPLYCWYDTEDNLVELVGSYEFVAAPGVRGSSTILTGCDLALSGNKKTTQFTSTVDSKYDSLSIRITYQDPAKAAEFSDGEIVASVARGNGTGSVIARACVYNCTWNNEWHFHGWTPGTPETDMMQEVLGSQYCDWCDLSEIKPNDPYAWLECMGMEPYPLHNYIGYYTTTECTGTFYPNDTWNIGYVKLNSFGHSNGNSFSAVGLGFYGECNAIIPFYDCAAVYLMSEITSQSAGLITLSRATARGSTLWDYCPGGAKFVSCDGNDHVVSAYGVGPFPRQGSYHGGWGPGITWVPETGHTEYHTGSEYFIDRRIIFVGRDGVGRTLLNTEDRGSAAFQAKLAGYPLLGDLSVADFIGAGFGIVEREVVPENDDWQDDTLWPWFADYLGPVYGVCVGAGSTVFGMGPRAWQSAEFNVIIAARGSSWVADENGADDVLPSLDDDAPYLFSWVGWA